MKMNSLYYILHTYQKGLNRIISIVMQWNKMGHWDFSGLRAHEKKIANKKELTHTYAQKWWRVKSIHYRKSVYKHTFQIVLWIFREKFFAAKKGQINKKSHANGVLFFLSQQNALKLNKKLNKRNNFLRIFWIRTQKEWIKRMNKRKARVKNNNSDTSIKQRNEVKNRHNENAEWKWTMMMVKKKKHKNYL